MKIHLVTYATRRFQHRQVILAASARANKVVDRVWSFSPAKVAQAGFSQRCPELSLSERGSGFWAWKPFIISKVLSEVPDGDVVFYCDVGRNYPFKLLTPCVPPLLAWMEENGQTMLPGVEIPWAGPMSAWTKRDAFVYTDMDNPKVHAASPVQASFSLWRADERSRRFANKWAEWCADRRLVSDDPSVCGLPEMPDFRDHRHDQALLTLCCWQEGVKGIHLGSEKPPIDDKHPSDVARWLDPNLRQSPSSAGLLVERLAGAIEWLEVRCRRRKSQDC